MKWNWQRKQWPNFQYKKDKLEALEQEFIHNSGIFTGILKYVDDQGKENLKVELISEEAYKTSEIEGELLNRESLQSSIRKNFGLKVDKYKVRASEEGIAQMMLDLYENFAKKLNHQTLKQWNSLILYGKKDLNTQYRHDDEPMQIVSGAVHKPKVHFEAPPADKLKSEMDQFIAWFNNTKLTPLIKAGIAHLYFVSIHPFDDGNGRIARALAEKVLSQYVGYASLIALSVVIEKERKKYYKALDLSNQDLEITSWLEYFAHTVIEAQKYSQDLIEFLIKKTNFYESKKEMMNPRQNKVISRMLQEGVKGFEGGLSAENYISISKTSRATATRDLQDLVEKKILDKRGKLKNTRYYLSKSSF